MNIKLDMGQAWNDAVAMLSANKGVIAIVAGVFFFLPNVIVTLLMPEMSDVEAMAAASPEDPQAIVDMMMAIYAENWWLFLLSSIVQAIGMLGLLALLASHSRPTVGEALSFGAKAVATYIAAQLLIVLLMALAVGLPVTLGAMIHPGIAALLGLIGFVLLIYLMVKFSLSSAVIAVEKQLNPVSVLQRSWEVTKGNSLRIFGFYVLLFLVLMVVAVISGMVFSIFAIMGEQIGLFGSAIGGALLNALFACVMLAVLASVHRQLTGGASEAVQETFS